MKKLEIFIKSLERFEKVWDELEKAENSGETISEQTNLKIKELIKNIFIEIGENYLQKKK